jgi:hypothetical protein
LIYIAKLLVTFVFFGITVFMTEYLIKFGIIKMESFPFAFLSGLIIALTLIINEVTTYLVGIIIENKELKNKQTLSELLDEKLKPIKDDLKEVKDSVSDLKTNQIALVTELRTQGVVKQTPVLQK